MTITSTITEKTASGNGVATNFSLSPLRFMASEDLYVYHVDVNGTHTLLVEVPEGDPGINNYYISLTTPEFLPTTGSITYPASGTDNILALGEGLYVTRIMPLTQETDLENQGGYFPDVQEQVFDRLTMQMQQLQTQITEIDDDASPVDSVLGRTGDVIAVAGDYTATQITNTPAGNIAATTVQAALNELDTEKASTSHTHAASAITNTPAGNIAATDVQAAINELDTEKSATSHTHTGVYEPADADLTALAALSGTGIMRRTGAATYSTGTGISTAEITDAQVTLAKQADLAADRLIGRGNGGGTGVPQAISLGSGLAMTGTTLAATAAAPTLVYLTQVDASASADVKFDLTSYTGYRHFLILFDSVLPQTDGAELFLRFSDDGGGTFEADAADYEWNYLALALATGVSSGDNSDSEIQLCEAMGNVAGEGMRGHLWLFDPHTAATKVGAVWHIGYFNSASNTTVMTGQGRSLVAFAVTDLQFICDAGQITSGQFSLYGIKDS